MKCPWPLVQSLSYPCICWWNPCLHRLNHKKFYLLFVGQTGVKSYLPNNFNGENVWKYANTAQDWSPCSEKPETSFWCCFGGLIPNFVGKISSTDTSSRLRCCPKRPLNRKSPKCQVARRWFARWFKACFPKGKFTTWLGNRKGESVYFLKVSFLANPSLCGYHVDDNHFFRGWIPMITCSVRYSTLETDKVMLMAGNSQYGCVQHLVAKQQVTMLTYVHMWDFKLPD